tara:strand:+ start:700 stop:1035 length:336 start_codon:yes stop_codon:yes gene_type:complete
MTFYTGLTKRQGQTLAFIRGYMRRHDHAPSYREIADGIGVKSKSRIHHYVYGLKARGYVRITPALNRSIALVHPQLPPKLVSAIEKITKGPSGKSIFNAVELARTMKELGY